MEVEMEKSEINNSVAKSETNLPYKIFISHKVSEHGGAVKKLKKILNQNNTLKDKIEIFVSTAVSAGEDWVTDLYAELDKADMLLYVYCFNSPPTDNDWCIYETGYFAKSSNRSNLITIVPAGVKPPPPLQIYQFVELTKDGIEALLKRIYEKENIYPDLFHTDFKEQLDNTVAAILRIFGPTAQKPIALSPRIWITLKNESVQPFKERKISLPLDSAITGETEAARKFGYESNEKEEITLEELSQIVEFKGTLSPFYSILSDTLQDILNKKHGPWRVPPVKVLSNKPPRIIVPAYLRKLSNGDHKFEFVVTEPTINFDFQKENQYINDLYNLFIVAWHFRWRVVNQYLYQFKRIRTANADAVRAESETLISKLRIDLNAIILDSYNRGLQFPEDIIRNFEGHDRSIMKKIVDSRDGLWIKLMPKFEKACDEIDLDALIDCLLEMQDMNKTCILACLKFLEKLVAEKLEGNLDLETISAAESQFV
jgi:hypothetical protein